MTSLHCRIRRGACDEQHDLSVSKALLAVAGDTGAWYDRSR